MKMFIKPNAVKLGLHQKVNQVECSERRKDLQHEV